MDTDKSGKASDLASLVKRACVNLLNTRSADKSLARPTSRCILFDSEDISFDASLVIYIYIYIYIYTFIYIYIYSTDIPPIMIINRIYEHQNLLSL